eukprot:scaffold22813_cov78-Cyclotella_meneghiniana.AAC.14
MVASEYRPPCLNMSRQGQGKIGRVAVVVSKIRTLFMKPPTCSRGGLDLSTLGRSNEFCTMKADHPLSSSSLSFSSSVIASGIRRFIGGVE